MSDDVYGIDGGKVYVWADGMEGVRVEGPKDLETLSQTELVALFNLTTIKPAKRFKSKAAGVEKVWALMSELVKRSQGTTQQEQFREAHRGKKFKRKNAKMNPRNKGTPSHTLWAEFTDGCTIDNYEGPLVFLAHEIRQGRIVVT